MSYQNDGLLPFCVPHVKITPVHSFEIPPESFPAPAQGGHESEGGRLELHRGVSDNPVTRTQDVFLQLHYYPRSPHAQVIDRALSAETEVYQESFSRFLLRVPNDFHVADLPSHEQDPAVFDTFRIQLYDSVDKDFEARLPGEFAKEYDAEPYLRTWEDVIERLMRIFNQNTTFQDPSLGGATEPADVWPDEKAGSRGFGGASGEIPAYNPSSYASQQGQLMFVDERTGSPVLTMDGAKVETINIQPGVKDPVEVIMPPEGSGGNVIVRPAEYLRDAQNPAYANSSLVNTAASASRFIVMASETLASAIASGADTFTKKTKPTTQPVTFSPATHNRVQTMHKFSSSAVVYSGKAVETIQKVAQNVGAKVAGRTERDRKAGKKPGLLNKSLIAFGTVADGIDHAAKNLLHTTSSSVTTVVGHRYGEEARNVAHGLGGSIKNVGMVYVDASGVSRRAVVKSVAKGMIVGQVKNKDGKQEEVIMYGGSDADERAAGTAGESSQAGLPAYSGPSNYPQEKPSGYSSIQPTQAYTPSATPQPSVIRPPNNGMPTLSTTYVPSVPQHSHSYPASPINYYGQQPNLGVHPYQHGGASGRSSPVPPPPGGYPPPPKY